MKRTICLLLLLAMLPTAAFAAEALYTAQVTRNYGNSTTNVYAEQDTKSRVLTTYRAGQPLVVTAVYPNFLEIEYRNGVGYILRHRVDTVEAIDPVNTPPYGVDVYRYFTTLTKTVDVLAQPKADAQSLITLQSGTQLAFIDIVDGYARLVFKRQYGFVDTRLLTELSMTAATPEKGTKDIPIAVFTSFYNIATNELNLGRMKNLSKCCERMERVMQPGERLDFNNQVGPFSKDNGYQPAPVLVNGDLVPGYGGGSCQVSSTLYNVTLQLTQATVLKRRPHGANGATYLPHGVDASSGDLNFVFRNDYDFPLQIKTHVQDGALYIAFYKVEST